MRLKILCCEVFFRELCHLVAVTPHRCDVEFLPKGLHDLGTEKMLARMQERVDAVPAGTYDAIVLVYGLCNNGVAGLAARHTPLVIPKAHDCITLFMGNRAQYREYFNAHPGTYYRTTGWLERGDGSGAGEETISQKLGLFMQYEELVRKYGEENAQYIREVMGDGLTNYDRLTFIRMGLDGEDAFRDQTRKEAAERGWAFDEVPGDLGLLRRLVNGAWDADFVTVAPGQRLRPTHDDDVLGV